MGCGNLVGDGCNLLLVERLGNLNQLAGVTIKNLLVQTSYRWHAHNIHPSVVFVEYIQHLVPIDIQVKFVGFAVCRQCDIETVEVTTQVEQMDISCVGGQSTIEIAHHIVHTVDVAVKAWAGVQKCDLVIEAKTLVDAVDVGCEQMVAMDRVACVDNLLHLCAQSLNLALRELLLVSELAVEASAYGVADIEFAVAIEITHRLVYDE